MARLKKVITLAAVLGLFSGTGFPEPAQDRGPAHREQAIAIIDLLRSHGLEMESFPDFRSEPGKQWYHIVSPPVDIMEPRNRNKKITLKAVDASVYASAGQLTDLLALFRNNGGFNPVPVGCGEAWVENKDHFVPGRFEVVLIAGNVEIRIFFENTLLDDHAWTQEKEDWYERARAEHPAALRSLIAKVAVDVCRLGLDRPSGSPAPAERPAEPPSTPPPSKDPCGSDREALMAASLRARLIWANLQTLRAAISELDRAWESGREAAYWSGTLDVALMAGSVLAKPVATAFGAEILKQPLKTAVMEAALKGMIVESLKQFNAYCHDKDVQPAEVLAAVADKGGSGVANKVLNEFAVGVLEKMLMDRIAAGDMGGLEALQIAAGTVDGTMRGGTAPAMTKFLRDNYAAPAAQFMGLMLSLKSAIDGAWTAHGKLENLRLAIKELRDREIEGSRKWEAAMAEMDRTRSSYDYCRTLHPESPRDDAAEAAAGFRPETPKPAGGEGLRKSAETQAIPPPAGTLTAPGGESVVLPYKTASLSLEDGRVICSIASGDYYYSEQGLVSGSRLVSVDFQPLAVRTIEDLNKLLHPPGKDMLVLEFELPDGRKINLPIPLDR
jgi:hypothetical protein